jgi:hypothetical protein
MLHRVYWLWFVVAFAFSCGGSAAKLARARAASYEGERDTVYREAVAAVRGQYAEGLELDPGAGLIKTAWHALKVRTAETGRDQNRQAPGGAPTGVGVSQGSLGGGGPGPRRSNPREPDSAPNEINFVRFDVRLVGGPPWRVEVTGHASEFDHSTGKPMPLKGAERPYWLDGRQKKLEIAIHERLEKFESK